MGPFNLGRSINNINVDSAAISKLPLSNYILIGTLNSTGDKREYNLKVVLNSTGEILDAARFQYNAGNIEPTINSSSDFVHRVVAKLNGNHKKNIINTKKIAFANFVDISNNDEMLNQGRDITEKLIETFVENDNYVVLSRTDTLPLLFEEYLRMLQYTDEVEESQRQNAEYLIYGYYRYNPQNIDKPFSLYLYIDLIKFGRELIVLTADSWEKVSDQVNSSVADFFSPFMQEITDEDINASYDLFLKAIQIAGVHIGHLKNKIKKPGAHELNRFEYINSKEKILSVRKLLEESIRINPENYYAKISLDMLPVKNGRVNREVNLKEALKRSDSQRDLAYEMLGFMRRNMRGNIQPSLFDSIVSRETSYKVYQQLINEGYLAGSPSSRYFNRDEKSEQVYNYPHLLSLPEIDDDTAILIFEKLRSLIFSPGLKISYNRPRNGFHPRDVVNKRSWHQTSEWTKHNKEAFIHNGLAKISTQIHIVSATDLPYIDYYPEIKSESPARRKSNLNVAIDGFSTSAYLQTNYLESIILLGHILCQSEIGQCRVGRMMHSWIVDHTKPVDVKYTGFMFINVTKDVEEKDRLIFLAADAVDRVEEANLSKLFQSTLWSEDYIIKKSEAKIKSLENVSNVTNSEDASIQKIRAYANLIRKHCNQISSNHRKMRGLRKYKNIINPLADIAMEKESYKKLREELLSQIESDYPDAYPHFVIRSTSNNPIILAEQYAMIRRIVSGDISPIEPKKLITHSLLIFKRRVKAKDLTGAMRYIALYKDYFGITDNTAVDFSYLYHSVGNHSMAKHILNKFGKNSFTLSESDLENLDGVYRHTGFDENGRLTYTRKGMLNTRIIYDPRSIDLRVGDRVYKWELRIKGSEKDAKKRYLQASRKLINNQDYFAFGNGGKFTSKIRWEHTAYRDNQSDSSVVSKENTEVAKLITLIPLDDDELSKPEHSAVKLFKDGFQFNSDLNTAIKGWPYAKSRGPLLDKYFSKDFSRSRKISVVREKLYAKGYLSVNNIPKYSDKDSMRQKLEIDFSDYSPYERKMIFNAMKATSHIKGAGSVEIYHRSDDIWVHSGKLTTEDAIKERHFGIAVAISGEYALACDLKDGIYSFKKINGEWLLQERIESPCQNVAMNSHWAAVKIREKVSLFKNSYGHWSLSQDLVPKHYLKNLEKRYKYEYFGESIAVTDTSIFVGNPYGGANRTGELYIFNLKNDEWRETDVLVGEESGGQFGNSVSATNNTLIIGDPADPAVGKYDTKIWQSGMVYVYQKDDNKWNLKKKIVQKNRPAQSGFGSRVLLKANDRNSMVVLSKNDIFYHELEL